jgi:hypothetical protein
MNEPTSDAVDDDPSYNAAQVDPDDGASAADLLGIVPG